MFQDRIGCSTARGFFGITKKDNVCGILYGVHEGAAYIPFVYTNQKKEGLGSEVLRQLEKIFYDKKANPITGMVVYATAGQEGFYKKRGFASPDEPRLTGFSTNGEKLREKIRKNVSLLGLFREGGNRVRGKDLGWQLGFGVRIRAGNRVKGKLWLGLRLG